MSVLGWYKISKALFRRFPQAFHLSHHSPYLTYLWSLIQDTLQLDARLKRADGDFQLCWRRCIVLAVSVNNFLSYYNGRKTSIMCFWNSVIWLDRFSKKSFLCSDLRPSSIDNCWVRKWTRVRRKNSTKAPLLQLITQHMSNQLLKKRRRRRLINSLDWLDDSKKQAWAPIYQQLSTNNLLTTL